MDAILYGAGWLKHLVAFGLWIVHITICGYIDHMMALGLEFTKRYGKQHLTIQS